MDLCSLLLRLNVHPCCNFENLLVFMELCPESLLDSSNLVLFALLFEEDADDVDEDCMEDLADDDFAELSAKTELEDDSAPSSSSTDETALECSDFSFRISSLTTEIKKIFWGSTRRSVGLIKSSVH